VKAYTVYRYDVVRNVREPVGLVYERREKDRGNNMEGLLKLAQKLYPRPLQNTHAVISIE